MRKCRNWQTSKTKDLVAIAVVWVQVPSSAFFFFWKSLFVDALYQRQKKSRNCDMAQAAVAITGTFLCSRGGTADALDSGSSGS